MEKSANSPAKENTTPSSSGTLQAQEPALSHSGRLAILKFKTCFCGAHPSNLQQERARAHQIADTTETEIELEQPPPLLCGKTGRFSMLKESPSTHADVRDAA